MHTQKLTTLFLDNCPQKNPEGKTSALDESFIIMQKIEKFYNWVPFTGKHLTNY